MIDTLSDVDLFEIFEVGKLYYFCGLPLRFCEDGKFARLRGRGRPVGSSVYNERLVQMRVPLSLVPKINELKASLKSELEKKRYKRDIVSKTDVLIDEYIEYVQIK